MVNGTFKSFSGESSEARKMIVMKNNPMHSATWHGKLHTIPRTALKHFGCHHFLESRRHCANSQAA
jgi:hypothetical protein